MLLEHALEFMKNFFEHHQNVWAFPDFRYKFFIQYELFRRINK